MRINLSALVELLPEGKLKRTLKKILLVIAVSTVVACIAFFAFTVFLAKNATITVEKPAVKPTAIADTTDTTDETTTEESANKNISNISAEDEQTIATIKKVLYSCLFKQKLYKETMGPVKTGHVIFEIKPSGIAVSNSVTLNALLAKHLTKLQAPTTEGMDTYYALILAYDKKITDYNDYIYVIPGVSGTMPADSEFKTEENLQKYNLGNNTTNGTNNNTTGTNQNTGSNSGSGSVNTEPTDESSNDKIQDALLQKKALESDESACASIDACINAALAEEEIYKETAKLGAKGYVLLTINPSPKLTIRGGNLMVADLTNSLKELTAPKEAGKDVYYVLIEVSTSKEGNTTMYTVGRVTTITGSSSKKPTRKDFQ